ncbi:MAG: riboflavin biosynthesis protein RibD, partial [bacterium]|nr:riboflavin biosynthesis protein RibD [bacterium]
MDERDIHFMNLALDAASEGRGAVEPNPMVGAVIVRDDVELARGHHEQFGGPHAEPNAISNALRAGVEVTGATMYVTLEPCDH